jgi:hypothetical protein
MTAAASGRVAIAYCEVLGYQPLASLTDQYRPGCRSPAAPGLVFPTRPITRPAWLRWLPSRGEAISGLLFAEAE